jgi:hypothetical protein
MLDLTKPVQTRDGRAVRILATDAPGPRSLVVAVSSRMHPGREQMKSYTPDGSYPLGKGQYDLVNAPEKPKAVTFGKALKALKAGDRVTRRGWNGKDMWLYHVPANAYLAQTEAAKRNIGPTVPYAAYVAMKTADGTVVPWLASQTDILAEDWEVL